MSASATALSAASTHADEAASARAEAPFQAPLSLIANVRWTLGGNTVYAACQWGMLAALAKLGSPEMVGSFSLALAISAPVVMFTGMQLAQIQATDTRRTYRFEEYLFLRGTMGVVAIVTIAGIALAMERATAGAGRGGVALVILLVGVAKVVESISEICYGLFQQRERMDLCSRSLMLRGPLSLAGLCVGLVVSGALGLGLVLLSLTSLAIVLACDLPAARRLEGAPSPRAVPRARDDSAEPATLARLFRLALPMGVVTLLWTLCLVAPRYFIESGLGARELGFFSAMAYAVVAGTLVVHALGRSASPALARRFACGDADGFVALLRKLVGFAAVVGALGVLLAALAGPEALQLLYGPEYAAHAGPFVAIMAAGALGYVAEILVHGLTAARLFRMQLPLFAGALAVTVIGCALLVPRFGVMGAVAATGASFLLCSAGASAILSRAVRGLRA